MKNNRYFLFKKHAFFKNSFLKQKFTNEKKCEIFIYREKNENN